MAYRDYILCKTCKCKIVYDGDDNGRNRLETYWGNPEAEDWTVGLLCPDCIGQLEERDTALLRQALEALERCVGTCFDQYAHEQIMSRPEHFVNQTAAALRERLGEKA